MDFARYEIGDGGINQSMPGNRRESPECLSDDAHAKVTCAARGPGVPRMQVALVLDDELDGRELALQPIAQTPGAV